MITKWTLIVLMLAALLLPLACSKNEQAISQEVKTPPVPSPSPFFSMDLSSGQAVCAEVIPNKTVSGQELSPAQTGKVLERLPALPAKADQAQTFAKRSETLPPPRSGSTLNVPFPSSQELAPPTPAELAKLKSEPFKVLRYAPSGEVSIAPQLTITFSKPMTAVTSQEAAALTQPVILEPQPAGKWRWLGTRTLTFEPEAKRFPMATAYKVTIPKGIKSANGEELAQEVSFSFTTPALKLTSYSPNGKGNPLTPPIALLFNQRIDVNKLLPFVKVYQNSGEVSCRLASAKEYTPDKDWQSDRQLAIIPEKPLAKEADIHVSVLAGAPSAEGPLLTTGKQLFSFQTFGPFFVEEHYAGWKSQDPPPGSPWHIIFSNPIDPASLDAAKLISVSPKLPKLDVACNGSQLTITGSSKGNTTYTLSLKQGLRDTFGQPLDKNYSLKFRLGSGRPQLITQGGRFITADPSFPATYSFYTLNHRSIRVKLYQVQPSDYSDFSQISSWELKNEEEKVTIPGKLIYDKNISLAGAPDEFLETKLPLAPALQNGLGNAIVVLETPKDKKDRQDIELVWIQATNIGIDLICGPKSNTLLATSLSSGLPLAKAQIQLDDTALGETDAQGLCPIARQGARRSVLTVRAGQDCALLPNANLAGQPLKDTLRWYVCDDRGVYKPGETIHLKGYLRRLSHGPQGNVLSTGELFSGIEITLQDSRYNRLQTLEVPLTAQGSFTAQLTVPDNANLGEAPISFKPVANGLGKNSDKTTSSNKTATVKDNNVEANNYTHVVELQEFRRPEFEVISKAASNISTIGEKTSITANAKYYSGGGLADAPVLWTVKTQETSFTPPHWDKFTFGTWRPWWRLSHFELQSGKSFTQTFSSKTDSMGQNTLSIDFKGVYPYAPTSVQASAAVSDVNRQTWSGSSTILVHPSSYYVGVQTPSTFVEAKKPIKLELIVTDTLGQAQTDKEIIVKSSCQNEQFRNGSWVTSESDIQEHQVKSQGSPVSLSITPQESGMYKVTADVKDQLGRLNRTSIIVWVAGGLTLSGRTLEKEEVELIPDKPEHRIGQTASVLLRAPFYPATGIMTINREGIVEQQAFTLSSATHTLHIPIKESYVPNISLSVTLLGNTPRLDEQGQVKKEQPPRPAYATGSLTLKIPPYERTLKVNIQPKAKALAPGGQTSVQVKVQDGNGKPVEKSEICLIAVDEAVLALMEHTIPNPIKTFYSNRAALVSTTHSRETILLNDASSGPNLEEINSGQMQDSVFCCESVSSSAGPSMSKATMRSNSKSMAQSPAAGQTSAPEIKVRSDFNPLAHFSASQFTDSQGECVISLKLPDNLTRYRLVAIASIDNRFGLGESSLLARLPLMVRPSAPRFLNFGDTLELPVVVHNQTDKALQVDLALRAQNLKLTKAPGRQISVPANDRVEVRFPATTLQAGSATLQVAAVSGTYADAASISLPVWTPCTTEAFATYGQLDSSSKSGKGADQVALTQPVSLPGEIWTQFGGLEVTTSSTALQELTDAVIYLVRYPFDCSEQRASRIIALMALRDVLQAFRAQDLPSESEIKAFLKEDMSYFARIQDRKGGFPLWSSSDRLYPFVSVHVANALVQAKLKGEDFPKETLNRSLQYLQNIERNIPKEYSDRARQDITAYAIYVLAANRTPDVEKARTLAQSAGISKLSLSALGWILPTLAADPQSQALSQEIITYLNNHVSETAGSASFTESYSDQDYVLLHSNRRTDGIILEALIKAAPQSDLIPKVTRGLMEHRNRGRWNSTQENVFILLALDRYFRTYENVTPDFVAKLWIGQDFAAQHRFQGRSQDYQETKIPMAWLAQGKTPAALTLSKEGPGRLYYRIGMKYAPRDLKQRAAEYGFTVLRSYSGLDNPQDVVQGSDGSWRVKNGSRVSCKVTMVANSRRTHVALVDPLPAGFEVINTAFSVTEELPEAKQEEQRRDTRSRFSNSEYGWWYWRPWYNHANLRDERVEAFADELGAGVYEYTYTVRATTPGSFVVPPAKAEEMYHPEVFGRSDSTKVTVF